MIGSKIVPCPACLVPAGEPCTAPDERSRHGVNWTHLSRDDAAEIERERRRGVTVALATLQFANGGLFDSVPADPGHRIHLIRMNGMSGTPGDTLCGIPRFGEKCPAGWSVGGGVSDPEAIACPECVAEADVTYPGLPVWGSTFGALFDRPAAPWDVRTLV